MEYIQKYQSLQWLQENESPIKEKVFTHRLLLEYQKKKLQYKKNWFRWKEHDIRWCQLHFA